MDTRKFNSQGTFNNQTFKSEDFLSGCTFNNCKFEDCGFFDLYAALELTKIQAVEQVGNSQNSHFRNCYINDCSINEKNAQFAYCIINGNSDITRNCRFDWCKILQCNIHTSNNNFSNCYIEDCKWSRIGLYHRTVKTPEFCNCEVRYSTLPDFFDEDHCYHDDEIRFTWVQPVEWTF